MEEFVKDVRVLEEHVFVEDGMDVTLVYLSLHANEGTRIEFLWGGGWDWFENVGAHMFWGVSKGAGLGYGWTCS